MEDPKKFVIPFQPDKTQSMLNKSRLDQYKMILNLPDALRGSKSVERSNKKIDFNALQFTIYGSPVPDIIVPSIGQMYAGQELKISSHTRQPYENIFIDFNIDNLYRNWWVVYYWLNLLNDEKESYFDKYDLGEREAHEAMQDYTANFTIYGMDEYKNNVIKFDYEGCFPVSLTSPKYNDRDTNEIQSRLEFAFTFFTATLV